MTDLHEGLDGYVWEVREKILSLRGFDPGIDLLPGVPAGAKRMTQLGELMKHVGPTVDWPSLGVVLRFEMYGEGEHAQLSRRDQNDFYNRFGNAVTLVGSLSRGDFPPPPDDAIKTALMWAFDGIVVETIPQRRDEEAGDADRDTD